MKARLYHLDLLRFLAALAVLFFHYTFRGYMGGHLSPVGFPALSQVTKYGYLGVDLFFIISGFVILMSAQDATLKEFTASRISRLYPAYWVAVTLTSVIILMAQGAPFSVSIKQYLLNMTMLNGFINVLNIDGVYWSLLVEMKFYIFIGVILFFYKMAFIKQFIIAWLVLSVGIIFVPAHSIISKAINTLFITQWSSYFIGGMLFYLIRREGLSLGKVLLLITSLCLSVYLSLVRMSEMEVAYLTAYSPAVIVALIISFYAVFLLLSMERLEFSNRSILIKLGALTYPLYLIHQFIGYILFNVFAGYNKYAVLLSIIIAMLFVSYLINRFVEKKLGPWLRQAMLTL